MSVMPSFHRMPFLLLCILGTTLVTFGLLQPQLSLRSHADDVDMLFPSISLRDWSIQTANSKTGVIRQLWLFALRRAAMSAEGAWPAEWTYQGGRMVKKNLMVSDDSAFREKSKLLTSMERQKWLNSYVHKLVVVKSS